MKERKEGRGNQLTMKCRLSGALLEPKMIHTRDATFATGIVSIERIYT